MSFNHNTLEWPKLYRVNDWNSYSLLKSDRYKPKMYFFDICQFNQVLFMKFRVVVDILRMGLAVLLSKLY